MANIDKKVEIKTCSEYDTSSYGLSNNEEDMPHDVILQNSHMISLQCLKYKEKYKSSIFENTELKKSNGVLRRKNQQTLEESLSEASKTDESSIIEKLREEVACPTKDFGKFLESSNTNSINILLTSLT